MRIALGAVGAFVCLAGAAFAQNGGGVLAPTQEQIARAPPSNCPDYPVPPSIPNGATARGRQMQEADVAIASWDAAYRTVDACRRAEDDALERELIALQAQRMARAAEANAARATFTQTCTAWFRAVNAYNVRNGRPAGEIVCE